jgi:hypothetical protein
MPTHSRDHGDCGAWRLSAAEKVRQRQAADRAQKDLDRQQYLLGLAQAHSKRMNVSLATAARVVAAISCTARQPAAEDVEAEAAE